MRKSHNLVIGERSAEKIKIEVGSALENLEDTDKEIPNNWEVQGRDQTTGKPKAVEVSYKEIARALDASIKQIEDAIMQALAMTPPELAAASTPAAMVGLNPALCIIGIVKVPVVAVFATALPESEPIRPLPRTETLAGPPVERPNSFSEKSMMN